MSNLLTDKTKKNIKNSKYRCIMNDLIVHTKFRPQWGDIYFFEKMIVSFPYYFKISFK